MARTPTELMALFARVFESDELDNDLEAKLLLQALVLQKFENPRSLLVRLVADRDRTLVEILQEVIRDRGHEPLSLSDGADDVHLLH